MTNTAIRQLIRLIYGSYAWVVLLVIVVPVTLGLLVLPGVERRRRLAKEAARMFLSAIGSPVAVSGALDLTEGPPVVVANHGSYLDGIILTAILPPEYTFLIKAEMNRVPLAGLVLRRLRSEFVDRANPSRRHASARRLVTAAHSGAALAVFPEGTFDGDPGLKPFHLGAFRAAFRAHRPVTPIVIDGARTKLPAKRLFAAPGPLRVLICEALRPESFASETELMDAARATLLAHMTEPDLATDHIPA